MNGIIIVVFLVRCASDLLWCEAIDTASLHFPTMRECSEEAAALVSDGQAADPARVWMAKCHYLLAEADGRPAAAAGSPLPRAGEHRSDRQDARAADATGPARHLSARQARRNR